MSQLSKAGFSVDTAKAFLPVVLNFMKDKLSPETMKAVEAALPGVSNLIGGVDTGGLFSKVKKLFG
jgi:uncharacterized protein (DUF2267 family)